MPSPNVKSGAESPSLDKFGAEHPIGAPQQRNTAVRSAQTPVPGNQPYDLSVIVPTFNERDNVLPLIETLVACLEGSKWEAIFVDDDSPDGTAERVRELIADFPNVRCIQRIGRRGLSTACLEGMLASSSPFLAVVDGDLQHDLNAIPLMLHTLRRDQLEIVVGSRYVDGGGTSDWARSRLRVSGFATLISKAFLRAPLKDPMSGFFVLRRELLDRTVRRMSGKGFKILLDIFLSADGPVRFSEIPYTMRSRISGSSKLDALVVWEFLMLIVDKLVGRFIPVRFIMFVAVGLVGAVGHLVVLGLMTKAMAYPFIVGQAIATIVAMTINFLLNNTLTHRDKKRQGWRILSGLVSFYVACSIGASINITLASFLFGNGIPWWMSGLLGALVGSVWNFAITSSFTWRQPGPSKGRLATISGQDR